MGCAAVGCAMSEMDVWFAKGCGRVCQWHWQTAWTVDVHQLDVGQQRPKDAQLPWIDSLLCAESQAVSTGALNFLTPLPHPKPLFLCVLHSPGFLSCALGGRMILRYVASQEDVSKCPSCLVRWAAG